MNFTKKVLESSVLREWGDHFNHVSFFTQIRDGKTLTDMSIFVDEERRGLGLARRMLQRLFFECDKDGFESAYVYIDTDCSDGFWDHVGFTVNPLYEDISMMEYGYEKRISWELLRTFAHANGT
jgi:GNAT superfamily N-acetyltransferase